MSTVIPKALCNGWWIGISSSDPGHHQHTFASFSALHHSEAREYGSDLQLRGPQHARVAGIRLDHALPKVQRWILDVRGGERRRQPAPVERRRKVVRGIANARPNVSG